MRNNNALKPLDELVFYIIRYHDILSAQNAVVAYKLCMLVINNVEAQDVATRRNTSLTVLVVGVDGYIIIDSIRTMISGETSIGSWYTVSIKCRKCATLFIQFNTK